MLHLRNSVDRKNKGLRFAQKHQSGRFQASFICLYILDAQEHSGAKNTYSRGVRLAQGQPRSAPIQASRYSSEAGAEKLAWDISDESVYRSIRKGGLRL